MKPCAKCKRQIPEEDYPLFHGKRTGTCEACSARARELYHQNKPTADPIPFDAVRAAYGLTDQEARAVETAVGQVLKQRRWKICNPRLKWRGKTAEAVVDAVGKTVTRRCQLLGAVSHRLKERLVADGIDPAEWFNWRRGLR